MTESEELRYAADRELLLAGVARFERPADALEMVLEQLGYSVEFRSDVPEPKLAFCDFEFQRVVVADNLAERLTFPISAPGVLRSCLAHELGHIRLHADKARRGIRYKCWEERAHEYAMVFMMPRERVLSRPQVRILRRGWVDEQEQIWNLIADLGQEFGVNGSYMCRALVAYGVVKMNRKTRVIKPCLRPSVELESDVA
jgi:hypothetical protein